MNAEQTERASLPISQEKLLNLVRTMVGGTSGREDDEHPLPPGPWDPVIRIAFERISVFGPRPEPWRVVLASILAKRPEWGVIGGGPGSGEEVALNPQPLPPRFAFLLSVAGAVVSRAELLQEIADATPREGEQRGIIIVSGYIGRFVDDFCGTGFRLRYPFPGPRPQWFAGNLDGTDLVVMATGFEQAAKEAFSPELRQSFADASTGLAEAGLRRLL